MTHSVRLSAAAQRDLDRLDTVMTERVLRRIESLAANPRPHGVEKMAGPDDLYRVRAGDWRIIYQIADRALTVLVVKIGHRREVYR
jgi:mRNA interferase RelE/StbE